MPRASKDLLHEIQRVIHRMRVDWTCRRQDLGFETTKAGGAGQGKHGLGEYMYEHASCANLIMSCAAKKQQATAAPLEFESCSMLAIPEADQGRSHEAESPAGRVDLRHYEDREHQPRQTSPDPCETSSPVESAEESSDSEASLTSELERVTSYVLLPSQRSTIEELREDGTYSPPALGYHPLEKPPEVKSSAQEQVVLPTFSVEGSCKCDQQLLTTAAMSPRSSHQSSSREEKSQRIQELKASRRFQLLNDLSAVQPRSRELLYPTLTSQSHDLNVSESPQAALTEKCRQPSCKLPSRFQLVSDAPMFTSDDSCTQKLEHSECGKALTDTTAYQEETDTRTPSPTQLYPHRQLCTASSASSTPLLATAPQDSPQLQSTPSQTSSRPTPCALASPRLTGVPRVHPSGSSATQKFAGSDDYQLFCTSGQQQALLPTLSSPTLTPRSIELQRQGRKSSSNTCAKATQHQEVQTQRQRRYSQVIPGRTFSTSQVRREPQGGHWCRQPVPVPAHTLPVPVFPARPQLMSPQCGARPVLTPYQGPIGVAAVQQQTYALSPVPLYPQVATESHQRGTSSARWRAGSAPAGTRGKTYGGSTLA